MPDTLGSCSLTWDDATISDHPDLFRLLVAKASAPVVARGRAAQAIFKVGGGRLLTRYFYRKNLHANGSIFRVSLSHASFATKLDRARLTLNF